MKPYFIYLDGQQIGPLSFDELKEKKITRETLVWQEGNADWQKAETIEKLNDLFKSVPPPIKLPLPVPPVPNVDATSEPVQNYEYEEPVRILGIRKNIFMYSILGLAFIICIFSFGSYNQKEEIEKAQTQEQLEDQEQQLREQEAAIAEQNARIAEQERLEKERIEKERKAGIELRMTEINEQLTTAYGNLENAKRKLNDVSGFKLLRSSSARHEQVTAAENVVESWKTEISNLEAELQKLQAEY
ncbi:DUF4339 domain-containing protein [uncultured Flavobacterium sp.]|uniref:DUF4339 domain-containing protein n=1 Tax=uncultured Flavobacterium sp. TaxID=165435 RepID=UPI0025FD0C24|nr:DUF4339 domain-containing protein [uncultured Flavobacterium sp.]